MNQEKVSAEIWSMIRETQKNLSQAEQDRKKAEENRNRAEKKAQEKAEEDRKKAEQDRKKAQEDRKDMKKDLDELFKKISIIQEETSAIQKETAEQMKETDRQIQKIGGRFNQRWGALVESLVEGKLVKIFQGYGVDITQTHIRSESTWRKPDGTSETREFDIIVANGTEVVCVEVKTALTQKDVRVFLDTLKDFRHYFRRYKTETIYGAMAYLSSENKAHILAEKEGLFIIKATGDSASLVNQKNFKPKTFC